MSLTEPRSKKIIMIVGAGRSGSTLLDKALGSHSQCFSLGEIINLNLELKRAHSVLCGCSSLLADCPFWANVLESITSEIGTNIFENPHAFRLDFDVDPGERSSRGNHMGRTILMLAKLKKYRYAALREPLLNTSRLYDEIIKKTGADILIDSSKNLVRALAIESALFQYQVKFVHLVRDGRAVLHSTQKGFYTVEVLDKKEKKTVEKTCKDEIVNPETAINRWRKDNLKALFALKLFRNQNSIMVRFEDLADFPEVILGKICRFIGVPFERDMLKLDRKANHMICGNASRINARRIEKPQEKWRTELDGELLKMFDKKAGILNRYLGYG
jgi:hypothetical protein